MHCVIFNVTIGLYHKQEKLNKRTAWDKPTVIHDSKGVFDMMKFTNEFTVRQDVSVVGRMVGFDRVTKDMYTTWLWLGEELVTTLHSEEFLKADNLLIDTWIIVQYDNESESFKEVK